MEALARALHLGGGDLPWQYIEYLLCKKVYHCRPSELAEEDLATVRLHLEMIDVESEVMKLHGGKG